MKERIALEYTAGWRRLGDLFFIVLVPAYHIVGGFFILDFVASGEYTWGRTLRTFVLGLSNLILAYEFVYRDLETTHPDWPASRLNKSLLRYSVMPFVVGMILCVLLRLLR